MIANGTTLTTSGYAWDTSIVVAWQSKDLSLYPHHPTVTGSWNIAKGIASSSTPSTIPLITVTDNGMFISAGPATDGSGSSGSCGLSRGAQAGVGVGVSLFVTLAAAGVLLFWRRKRSRNTPTAYRDDDVPPELPGTSTEPKQLGSDGLHEKAATEGIHEDVGYTLSHELKGTRPDGTFLRTELEGDTKAELEGDPGPELEGDIKPAPDYESAMDYSRDMAKVDL